MNFPIDIESFDSRAREESEENSRLIEKG